MSGGSKKQIVGYKYYMGLHLGVCAGPVDALLELRAGDRSAWTGTQTASGSINVSAKELFGGDKKEGGLEGTLDVMMGEPSQAANSYLASAQTGYQPAYRGLFGLVWRQGLIGSNNPYIKPWGLRVRRILKGWQSDAPWYSAKAEIVLPDSAGKAMNPAHIIYECMTNAEWGMGYGTSLLDSTTFTAAADTFHSEGLGLCIQWTRQQPIETFIQQILDHAGAVLAQDRRTGLFKLKPLRQDYTVATLPTFDESNVISLDSYQRPALSEAVNQISVQYDDLAAGKQGSVTVQNLAQITAQGGVLTQGRNYPGLPTGTLALRVALRDLRAVSSPLAKVRMQVNRAAYGLLPGDVIKLNWTRLGLADLVLRVVRVNAGTVTDGAIELECTEDVFSLPAAVYSSQPPTGWGDTSSAPAAATNRVVTEAPWFEVARAITAAERDKLPNEAGFLQAVAAKPSADAYSFDIRTREGTTGAFDDGGTAPFAPSGTLASALSRTATSATLNNLTDKTLIKADTYAVLGSEIVRIDSFNPATGQVTIGRGVLDTVAATHQTGEVMLFCDPYSGSDNVERVDGETLQVKLLTRTAKGLLNEASAPTDTVTFDQRHYRPYPPGQLRINGQAYPATVNAPMTITWAHRDRTVQNLQGDETGNIGPEAGTTYSIELRNSQTNALLDSATGIVAATYTPPAIAGVVPMRLRLWSNRGSYAETSTVNTTATVTTLQAPSAGVPNILKLTFSGMPNTLERYDLEVTYDNFLTVRYFVGGGFWTTVQVMSAIRNALAADADNIASATISDFDLTVTGKPNVLLSPRLNGTGYAIGAPYLDSRQRHEFDFDYIGAGSALAQGATMAASAQILTIAGGASSSLMYYVRPVINFDGKLLATGRVAPTGASRLFESSDNGQTYTTALTSTSPTAFTYGVSFFDFVVGSTRVAYGKNRSAAIYSVVTATTNAAATYTESGPTAEDGKVIWVGATRSDGTTAYIVGRNVDHATSQWSGITSGMFLHSTTDGLNLTRIGEMLQDPADPNAVGVGTTYAEFIAKWFVGDSTLLADSTSVLERFGTRWFLCGAYAIYYNDAATPTTGWRRAPTGLGEQVENYFPPTQFGGLVQLGSKLVAWTKNVANNRVAYSSDNGDTWTAQNPSVLTNVYDRLQDGFVLSGTLYIYLFNSATSTIDVIYTTDPDAGWTRAATTGLIPSAQQAPYTFVVSGARVACTQNNYPNVGERLLYTANGIDFNQSSGVYDSGAFSSGQTVSGATLTATASLTAGAATAPAFDPSFASVRILLHLDGANGATTFPDSSGDNRTVTRSGDAAITTAQSKFGGASAAFDGTLDFLSIADAASLRPGASDFTVEAWVMVNSTASNQVIFNKSIGTGYYPIQILYETTAGKFRARGFDTANSLVYDLYSSGPTPSTATWYHLALCRSGSTIRFFVDGALAGSANIGTASLNASTGAITLGAYDNGVAPLNGYIDELRYTVGVARYTDSFTAPAGPFPNS